MNRKSWLTFALFSLVASSPALAGGLFLPGAGAVSTSRAGAGTVSSDDGEALALNPANLAKTKGTTITLSAAIISYAMQFSRSGTYDVQQDAASKEPFDGTPFPTVKNDVKPKLGFGSFQPVPVFAIVSDLGGKVPGLHVAIGVYAPNAYPFRDMSQNYQFNSDFAKPPPGTRYDIIKQDAAVILPSVAAAYSISPKLDVGARFSAGISNIKSTTTIWTTTNFSEDVTKDGQITIEAKDNFVPVFGLGATFRPTPEIEVAANYTSQANIVATGTASSINGHGLQIGGQEPTIGPSAADPVCQPGGGGNFDHQNACVDLALPMSAQVGGRYKFLDRDGKERGDLELDLDWEHWSADRVSNYKVVVDATAYIQVNGMPSPALDLKPSFIHHGLKDTVGARLGGSYRIPMDANEVILRGGLAYDTRAAKDGWLRADIDGAARTTIAVGAGYKMQRWEFNIGGGVILEGTSTNPGSCNPSGLIGELGCDGTGKETPVANRNGLDPTNPAVNDNVQAQSPVNQGKIESHYVMFMVGATASF